jgi:hypothetical protein
VGDTGEAQLSCTCATSHAEPVSYAETGWWKPLQLGGRSAIHAGASAASIAIACRLAPSVTKSASSVSGA